jgi:hypothetical protein
VQREGSPHVLASGLLSVEMLRVEDAPRNLSVRTFGADMLIGHHLQTPAHLATFFMPLARRRNI